MMYGKSCFHSATLRRRTPLKIFWPAEALFFVLSQLSKRGSMSKQSCQSTVNAQLWGKTKLREKTKDAMTDLIAPKSNSAHSDCLSVL
jgi:hypothetical protein